MRVVIKNTEAEASKWTADYIASKFNGSKKKFVLGLCTGSTPIGVYTEWKKNVKAGKLSFKNVESFNMDEYVALDVNHPESYHSFMHKYLFSGVDEPEKNIHILNGNAKDLDKECADYEKAIVAAGGIDLFFGGIGEDGHIAFNEPFSTLKSRTRVVTLREDTRLVNSRFFDNDINKVPAQALSVGVSTITDAREVLILITGPKKAHALRDAIEGPVSHKCTASALQLHPNAVIVCDEAAIGELSVNTYRYFKSLEK